MAKPSAHIQQSLAKLFTNKKEEIDFLNWMKKILQAELSQTWMLQRRLEVINKKLDENAEKLPALRALFNKDFIKEISESNHSAIGALGGSQKKDFSTHTQDTINRTIKILIETINLYLLTATIATSKADVIVISAGSEGALEQQHPTFTKSFPQEKNILILNVDPHFITQTNPDSQHHNTAIRYFGTIFGNINSIKDLTYFTKTLLGPLRETLSFCKDIIEQALSHGKQHFVLQSFFNPGLVITELALYLGMKHPETIGSQLEIIGGYDEVFPVLLHSKEYFIQHKKRLEEITHAIDSLLKQKNILEAELQSLKTQNPAAEGQTPTADQQKSLTEKIDNLNKQITQLSEDIRKLEAKKLDVFKIITKHEGYNGIRNKPQNYQNARKEFAEQNFGEFYPNLSKVPSIDLFKASPTLRKDKAAALTAAFDAKRTGELQQQKATSKKPNPKPFSKDQPS